ncbi:MAG: rod shape-determining protein RodA [Candidatus Moranbacteria bacterium]|nr:rod shape-determining protein RodA [Candidatus Moranbacteria bacterium]
MFYKLLKNDWVLTLSVILLLGISMSVLYSISMVNRNQETLSVFLRQFIFVIFGFVAMFVSSKIDYKTLRSRSTLIYFVTVFILLGVLIFGRTIRGTAGWIGFGSFHVQPVEIAKLSLIVFLASFISQKKMELGETGRLIASFIFSGIMIILVIKQPDFGSAMVLISIWLGVTLIAGISKKKIIIMLLLGLSISFLGWFNLQPYQKDRVLSLVHPEKIDPRGAGYNVIQAMIAVGSGGLTGKGVGHGSQSQLNFLPEKHTDFIFASIAEELGLFGSFLVIGLYALMFYRMRVIAINAPDNFSYLVVVGIMLMFFVQILENIGMNIGIMPVTGIPLPLLSYGGSSLIVMLSSIGILNNIHSHHESVVKEEEY